MRNLKKLLALALAMAMAFSLMLTASARDVSPYDQVKEWTDKDQVTDAFIEAVDVLSGMEIFQGDEVGFRPSSTITRAETAALIYRLATGDVKDVRTGLYANYGNFTDVNESDWFSGYVGYCANAGYIKGTSPTTFNPYAPVTGYEALAMILRVVGYDKNHEFEGATWQVNVSALGTTLGALSKVKTTDYANTLHLASRRDVVASILFECAQLPTVTYTPAFGYATHEVSSGVDHETLGMKYFGLKSVTGIIVGNQDTGESMTRINWVKDNAAPEYYAYFHQTKNFNVWNDNANSSTNKEKAVEETTNTTTIDAKTGLDMFGHKVKAWYASKNATGANKGKTFTLYDNVVKTALVTPVHSDGQGNATYNALLSDSTGATEPQLGKAIQAAGFNVDLVNSKAVFNKDFGISGARVANAYSTGTTAEANGDAWVVCDDANNPLYVTDYVADGAIAKADATSKALENETGGATSDSQLGSQGLSAGVTPYPLYLVISNNSEKTPDLIIALNVEVSKVVQVNNYATHQTVTVPQRSNDGTETNFNDDATNRIAQGALTATSTKTLGDGVVAISIRGTKVTDNEIALNGNGYSHLVGYTQPATSPLADDGDTNLFRLSKPTKVVEGLVTQYKGSKVADADYTGDTVSHDGSIVINGQRIERSLLADTIVEYNRTNAVTGNQIQAVGLTATASTYLQYRAYLDAEGKYIWVEPIRDRTFLYGTYIDYTTPYASSSYEYTVVGINDKGEQVKQVVKTFDGNSIGANNYRIIGQWDGTNLNATDDNDSGLPYRDSQNVAGVTPGLYSGMTLGGNGDLQTNDIGTLGWTLAYDGATATSYVTAFGPNGNTENDADNQTTSNTVITSTDARLGMKETNKGTDADDSYYITEDTKIIAVSGAGTDTQKVKVYNGITELLDGASRVTIKHAEDVVAKGAISDMWVDGQTAHTLEYNSMMYYTTSNFTYASNVSRAKQIDTLILPADALEWTGRSNIYFIGNNEKTSEIQVGNNWYTQFTMYKDGERQNVWVEGRDDGTGSQDAGSVDMSAKTIATLGSEDRFYELVDSGKQMPDGTTVYAIENYVAKTTPGTSMTTDGTNGDIAYDAAHRPDVNGGHKPVIWGGSYWAATYSAQTAGINTGPTKTSNNVGIAATEFQTTSAPNGVGLGTYNVANAKVVNLNAADSPYDPNGAANFLANGNTNPANTGYIWNGITDLGSLNDAASTSAIFVTNGRQPVVSCLVDPANPLNVTVIYVHWNQDVEIVNS